MNGMRMIEYNTFHLLVQYAGSSISDYALLLCLQRMRIFSKKAAGRQVASVKQQEASISSHLFYSSAQILFSRQMVRLILFAEMYYVC
ncbi:hypothetical protein DC498_22160 [Terrimonas sp.]|nr:hypothetical protein DC498_22160 [Terrimonas sp.]